MITLSVATSDIAVAAFVTKHLANRSATHPSVPDRSLDRPLPDHWGRSHQLNVSPTRYDHRRAFSAAALAALSS